MEVLRERFGDSQRHACRVVGQHRSTQRLAPLTPSDDEIELSAFLRGFSKDRPRWGWRRAAKAARRAGWQVNDKRIQRLWRAEGLKVPHRKRKKPHRGIGTAVGAVCPIAPNARDWRNIERWAKETGRATWKLQGDLTVSDPGGTVC